MPILHVEMFQGRSVDEKRALAKALTDAVVASLGCDPATVRIIVTDVPGENWAIGGELQADRG